MMQILIFLAVWLKMLSITNIFWIYQKCFECRHQNYAERNNIREGFKNKIKKYGIFHTFLTPPLFNGTKFEICLQISFFFLSCSFSNLCIRAYCICICGLADLLTLSVKALFTWKDSTLLFPMSWFWWFLGNLFFNFGTSKHFWANFRHRAFRLSFKDCSFKIFRAFS